MSKTTVSIFGKSASKTVSINGGITALGGETIPKEYGQLAELLENVVENKYAEPFAVADTSEEYQALRNKIFVDKTIDGVDLDYNIHIKDLMTYYENEKVDHLKTFANLGLRTLHVVNIGAGQFNNLETYQNQITSLTQQVNTLQSQIPTAERSILINTDVSVEAELDVRYLGYVLKYGYPPNGVFDPVLLAEFL